MDKEYKVKMMYLKDIKPGMKVIDNHKICMVVSKCEFTYKSGMIAYYLTYDYNGKVSPEFRFDSDDKVFVIID